MKINFIKNFGIYMIDRVILWNFFDTKISGVSTIHALYMHKTKRLTLQEKDVCCLVQWSSREVLLDEINVSLGWEDDVDSLQVGEGLSTLAQVLNHWKERTHTVIWHSLVLCVCMRPSQCTMTSRDYIPEMDHYRNHYIIEYFYAGCTSTKM